MSAGLRKWTADEDRILCKQVELGGTNEPKDWTSIAAHLPGRTNKDCRKRWYNNLIDGLHKGPWNAEEDERLVSAIREQGQQWPLIADSVKTRSADQCAKRWNQALNPALNRSKWSKEEQRALLKAVKRYGKSWKVIQRQYFPNRATNNVKNSYMTLTRRESLDVDKILNQTAEENADDSGDEEDSASSTSPADYEPNLGLPSDDDPFGTHTTFDEAFSSRTDSLDDFGPLLGAETMDLDETTSNDIFAGDSALKAAFDTSGMQFTVSGTRHLSSDVDIPNFAPLGTSAGYSDGSLVHVDGLTAPPVFVLSISDPSTQVVRDVMGVLVGSKANFKTEMLYGDI